MVSYLDFQGSKHWWTISLSYLSARRVLHVVLVLSLLLSICWLGWRQRHDLTYWWGWPLIMTGTVFLVLYQWYRMWSMAQALRVSEREERFRLMVETAPNAIVVVNETGQIVLVNAQAEVWFGYSRDELLEQSVELLVPESLRFCHVGYRQGFIKAWQTRPMGAGRELYGRRKDGTEFPIEVGLTSIHTDRGATVLASIIDISERKAAEQLVYEHAEHAALGNRNKSEFLAHLAHELRTPLNSILILSEQLFSNNQANLSPRQVESAGIIHKSGEDLLELSNDILDLSRIEAGRMIIRPEKVVLSEFASYLRDTFLPIAQKRKIELAVELDQNTPAVVMTDVQRVGQIVKNLVSNAIKFTEAGGRVDIHFLRGSASGLVRGSGDTFCISVADTGVGIPAEKYELVFQAFQQLDGANREYHAGGSGLGLAISRQLASLLGGEIKLRSSLGKGSLFTLVLPVIYPGGSSTTIDSQISQEAAGQSAASPQLTGQPVTSQGGHGLVQDAIGKTVLLIAENDEYLTTLVLRIAAEHAFTAHLFAAGEEIRLLDHAVPAGVIVDILPSQMGSRMSGWQIVDHLRNANTTCHIPLLIISCIDGVPTRNDKCIISRLVKPVDNQQLMQAFHWLRVESDRMQQSLPAANVTDRVAVKVDIKRGKRVLLVDDDARNVYAMTSLLEDAGMEVVVAWNGQEALDAVVSDKAIDLILMDMMMPILDGYQAIKRLRRELGFQKPILAVTALAMRGDREKCIAAGADDYLAKPVTRQALYTCIEQWIAVR